MTVSAGQIGILLVLCAASMGLPVVSTMGDTERALLMPYSNYSFGIQGVNWSDTALTYSPPISPVLASTPTVISEATSGNTFDPKPDLRTQLVPSTHSKHFTPSHTTTTTITTTTTTTTTTMGTPGMKLGPYTETFYFIAPTATATPTDAPSPSRVIHFETNSKVLPVSSETRNSISTTLGPVPTQLSLTYSSSASPDVLPTTISSNVHLSATYTVSQLGSNESSINLQQYNITVSQVEASETAMLTEPASHTSPQRSSWLTTKTIAPLSSLQDAGASQLASSKSGSTSVTTVPGPSMGNQITPTGSSSLSSRNSLHTGIDIHVSKSTVVASDSTSSPTYLHSTNFELSRIHVRTIVHTTSHTASSGTVATGIGISSMATPPVVSLTGIQSTVLPTESFALPTDDNTLNSGASGSFSPSSISVTPSRTIDTSASSTQVKSTNGDSESTADTHSLSPIPFWAWAVVAITTCIFIAVGGVICTLITTSKCHHGKGSYTVTETEREDPHGSLTSAMQRHFLPTGVFGRDLVSNRSSSSRFRAPAHLKRSTTPKTRTSSFKRSSSKRNSGVRMKRASFLRGSLSRSSINSLRPIDMKLDLVYSPDATQTFTCFTNPQEITMTGPNEDRAAPQLEEEGSQSPSGDLAVNTEDQISEPAARERHRLSWTDEIETRSDATNDSEIDMPIYAV